MTWTSSIVNVCSGFYFVMYTATVVSLEYSRYRFARCMRWLARKELSDEYSVVSGPAPQAPPQDDLFVTMVQNIASRLSKKNVYYTKLFQATAYSSEMYNDELASIFIRYTDAVDYCRTEYSNQRLNELLRYADEIGYTLTIDNNAVTDADYTPSKTGSVSLIFYGTLEKKITTSASTPTPIPVVIKYLRENMVSRVQHSINDFKYMVALLDLIPQFKHLHLNDIFNEQKTMMLSQVNFHAEVENIKKMYRNFETTNTTFIKIPLVYPEFTTKFDDIIVMERISGKTLEQLSYDEKDEYCGILAKGLIKSVFLDGFYHCDMHPGNILFMECKDASGAPLKRVGVFDFGIMSDLSVREQNISFELFKHILRRDVVETVRTIVSEYVGPYDATKRRVEFDKNRLHADMEAVIAEVFKDTQVTCFSAKDLCKVNYALLPYNLKVSGELTKLEISLSVCDNLCKKLAVHRSYMSYLKDLVDDMFE